MRVIEIKRRGNPVIGGKKVPVRAVVVQKEAAGAAGLVKWTFECDSGLAAQGAVQLTKEISVHLD